jgi:predicted MPP superfamily phosphohydrolase
VDELVLRSNPMSQPPLSMHSSPVVTIRVTAPSLLARARDPYDAPGSPFALCTACGFTGGAQWMSRALGALRGGRDVALPIETSFSALGVIKYAFAFLGALATATFIALTKTWWLSPLIVLAFYAVEVQMLFLFPLAIDRDARPFHASRRLMIRSCGSTRRAVTTVLPIAAFMLAGGLLGRGFVRSWAIGCLAVCIWYEEARQVPVSACQPRGFELGATRPPIVRRETCLIPPRECVAAAGSASILYVSDLHLSRRWTRRIPVDVLRIARSTRPDAIFLGGDLVDNDQGLTALSRLIARLGVVAPVYAVAGNHDARVGVARVRDVVRTAGGDWLGAEPVRIRDGFWACGEVTDVSRVPGVRVLCGHDPADFPRAIDAGFDLVLAGHLHGGQCAWFERGGRQYPGAWINRWTGMRFHDARSGCTMLVSRGAADTLPLRWNCPREVLLCQIQSDSA